MKVGDVSPLLLTAISAAAGVVLGLTGTWLARTLPRRYDIDFEPSDPTKRRRNAAIVILSIALCGGVGYFVSRYPDAPLDHAAISLVTHCLLSSALVTAAAIDLEHMILPHEITRGGAILALATAYFRGLGLVPAILGAVAGLALTYLPFLLYKKLRGHSGMGLGDAHLAVLAGAWLGIEGVIFVIFAGALQSALAALAMRLLGIPYGIPASVQAQLAALRKLADEGDAEAKDALADDPMAADVGQGKGVLSMRLPMGPFLVLGCIEFLFGRRIILGVVEGFFGG